MIIIEKKTYYPTDKLSPFVEYYAFLSPSGLTDQIISTMDFPRTDMDMLFCFDGHLKITPQDADPLKINTASFIGSFDLPYQIILPSQFSLLHIRFKTNGIYPLTKVPLYQLINQEISLQELLGNPISEIHEKMEAEKSDDKKINILEDYLFSIYQNSRINYRLNYGIELIQKQKGITPVKELSNQLNTNYKSLERWFKSKVGLSPKTFSSITRFKFILEEIDHSKEPDWMNLATNYGFHDQSHFIHSFQKYAGLTPEQYWSNTQLSNFYNEQSK